MQMPGQSAGLSLPSYKFETVPLLAESDHSLQEGFHSRLRP